ncbi:hypothetical protein LPJ66_005806 [Kickxella alabastrina]|uniref:Uncharacterized protein n=1 Tax=Kickxella alabastrina TaxID=61397 RepID=A0ACC1IHE6_9FUNG|nr:hypothetical protein LPJ66_005806 [Kickxella alabastrina]
MKDKRGQDNIHDSSLSKPPAKKRKSIFRQGSLDASNCNDDEQNNRRVNNMCVRCRLFNIKCNLRFPQCRACKRASVECFNFQSTTYDWLFGLLPKNPTLGNFAWQSNAHSVDTPDDVSSMTENLLRNQSGIDRLSALMTGPLKKAVLQYPDEERDADAQDTPLPQLPLPSSELLRCICRSVAENEASRPPQHPSLNEQLSGSSLLAMGVLLQEHSRFLL